MNGHRHRDTLRPKCANKRLMHRSKFHHYSMASDRCLRWTVNKALIKSLTQE
jgi:hypothetical protein